MRRIRPGFRGARRALVTATGLAVIVGAMAGALGGCGDDDVDATDTGSSPSPSSSSNGAAQPADAAISVDVERVGESLRIGWTVTNNGDTDLLLFDGREADDAADAQLVGAYVTGRDDGTVEISRRVFPVPDGVEVDGAVPGTLAVRLPPGGVASGRELVVLPFEYVPAASEGGGRPPSDDATSAVFCAGVGPLADVESSQSAADADDRYFVMHSEANADQQTLLCGDPIDL